MTPLASTIRKYYFEHFSELPNDKQFHFVSRLSAWSDDPMAVHIIHNLRPSFVTSTIHDDLKELINNPPSAKINAAERRAPYFAKYPELRGYMMALFRVRHLLFHYDTDVRSTLLAIVPKEELYSLSDALQQDLEATAVLSTYAINYIYLVEVILFPRTSHNMAAFLDSVIALADTYDDTAEDSLLLIYLFTHCIIGASNFYKTPAIGPAYERMLELLEQRIATHFVHINLDNKFEFLVCCRLTSFTTTLEKSIQDEAEQSISPQGSFLIDTMNQAGQKNKISFSDSEHRNVLYIMSTLSFRKQL
jgi:hypothetical protein